MEESDYFQYHAGIPHPIEDEKGKKIGKYSTDKLRSNVFKIMLSEVPNFCKFSMSWSSECHRQVS